MIPVGRPSLLHTLWYIDICSLDQRIPYHVGDILYSINVETNRYRYRHIEDVKIPTTDTGHKELTSAKYFVNSIVCLQKRFAQA